MTARELHLTDPVFVPPTSYNALERAALALIRDPRDLPFVWLTLQMTFVLLPTAAFLFWPGNFRWWMAPLYWALLFGVFFDRYILMLHNTSHRPLFKRQYNGLKFYIPWVLGPLCGETPETYYIHHITMHHAEGNLPRDLSSTMKYQRDSALDFFRYWSDFFFLAMFRLGGYQLGKKRARLVLWLLVGELSFYALVAAGFAFAPAPTLTVFIVPFLLCRFLMMAGNWGQHAFIDGSDPGNSLKSSITCINVRYNRRAFNDGYHISHHLQANRHWTEHPAELLQNRAKYVEAEAIVFEGIDFFQVWFLLMTKNWKSLASHFVDLGETPRSEPQIIALLQSRVQRLDVTRPEMLAAVPA
jgi:hypothetical protein